jgi:Ca2+-transporting ATPase
MLLNAAQILWLNFITDGLLNIALASKPFAEQKNIFYKKLITKKDLINFFLLGLVMATGSIIIFLINKEKNIIYRQNLNFLTFAAFRWLNAYNCCSLDKSVFKLKLLDNKKLLYSIAVTIILQIFITYSKIGQLIFNSMPLSLTDWIIAIFMASTVLIAFEILKFYRRFDEKQSE